jgi:HK97 gp10 family phage protein
MARFVFTGGQDLDRALRALPDALSHEILIEALIEAAEPIRAEAASLAPRGRTGAPHLADNIVAAETTRVTGSRRGRWRSVEAHEHVVAIGPSYQPHDHFYGMFQEFGTVHHPAQPFLRPALDRGAPKALQQLAKIIWRHLERATGTVRRTA